MKGAGSNVTGNDTVGPGAFRRLGASINSFDSPLGTRRVTHRLPKTIEVSDHGLNDHREFGECRL